jgi:DNA polymerase
MDSYCVTDCTRCPELEENRSQIVNGVGPMDASIVCIGEGPGETEDEMGEPFVGRSGENLTEAFEEAGITRSGVRITNTVRCRPPENRDPTTEEVANCQPYLYEEIQQVNPDVILPVGKVPCETLLDRPVSVTKEAGDTELITVQEDTYTLVITPHPAAMLYDRSLESVFYETIEKAVELSL